MPIRSGVKSQKKTRPVSNPATNGKTDLTDEVIDKITSGIRDNDLYLEQAVVLAGYGKSTITDWMKKGRENPEQYPQCAKLVVSVEHALAECEARGLRSINKSVNGQEWQYERYPEGSLDEDGNDISGNLILNARGNPIPTQVGVEPNWKAAAWKLERRFPKRWGRTIEIGNEDDEGPQVVFLIPSNGRERKE